MKLAEVKITYSSKIKPADRYKITNSNAVNEYLSHVYDRDTMEHHESFYVILLNSANRVLGHALIGVGGITGTVADIRVIMQNALLSNAVGIIMSHNHPSGNLLPSEADRNLTKQVKEACKIMGISLLDHLIVSPFGDYYSFSEEGAL